MAVKQPSFKLYQGIDKRFQNVFKNIFKYEHTPELISTFNTRHASWHGIWRTIRHTKWTK